MATFDEQRLDDERALAEVDPGLSLRALAGAGAQVRTAVHAAAEAGLDRLEGLGPRGVVVGAAGGSACVGDLLEALTRVGGAVPVQTVTSAPLPGWVGALDLVVAVSQSGRAAGALALAAEAGRRGASLLTVGAPDSPLADLSARHHGIHVPVRVDGAGSRTSMWAQAAPVLLAADVLGLASVPPGLLAELADVLDDRARRSGPATESFDNPAKLLACEVAESAAIVLGDGPFGGVAARRAAEMFGRTGRMPVTSGALPDAASQVVACFDGPLAGQGDAGGGGRDIFADPFLDGPSRPPLRLVLLRDTSPLPPPDPRVDGGAELVDDPSVAARRLAETVESVADDAGVRISRVDSDAPSPLLRLASHVALTDFAATYLAIGHGYDPATSPHVQLLRGARPGSA